MAIASTRRYRTGTASVTQGSTKVTGLNTRWSTAGINPGANFYIDGIAYANEIKQVVSDTEIQLVKPYIGQSVSGQSYSIDINYQATVNASLAARMANILGEYELIRDGYVVTINGKDAYEVYTEAGGTKTRAQFKEVFDANEMAVDTLAALDPYLYHNAGAHNSHYRGKTITFDESLSAAIRAGTFGGVYGSKFVDVYPGDRMTFSNIAYRYLDENDEVQNSTFSGSFLVAGCDPSLRCGDTDLTAHHLKMIFESNAFSAPMNDENITTDGYVGSKMRTKYLTGSQNGVYRRAEAIIRACFGSDHILPHREYLVNAVTDGQPSGGAWFDSIVELLDEREVYGSLIFDSGASDGQTVRNRYSIDKSQLPLFQHRPDLISSRMWYWLRNVVSPSYFANVGKYGSCAYSNASAVGGVRPAFLLY